MKISEFKLERFFAQHEFAAPYLMCCSDCESWTIQDLLDFDPHATQRLLNLGLGYTESKGNPALRQQIASLYQNIDPAQVLVFCGAEEAVFLYMQAVLSPGDHVIVQTPSYQSLYEIPAAMGCQVDKWEMKRSGGQWGVDMEELRNLITNKTRAIIINTPHNPTGYLMSQQELQEIISIARERDIHLFVDEVYKYLEYDLDNQIPWACDLYEKAVSLGVMSKSFGLAGLRIGWIASRDPEVYHAMEGLKDYTTICSSGPSELLSILALENREQIIKRNRNIITQNLKLLDDFFQQYKELFSWFRPHAGPIAFPAFQQGLDAEVVGQDLLQHSGVLILPARVYDYDHHHFRIGFGRKNFDNCLDRFEQYVKDRLITLIG